MSSATDQMQTYGLWIQTGAIIASAIGVTLTIFWNLRIVRRRATLDILLQEQSVEALIKERTAFNKLRDAGHLAQWAEPAKAEGVEAETIRATLNRYELVALGVREGTLHGRIYKRWCRTTLVRDWIACRPLVMELRRSNDVATYFCEFEKVSKQWANKSEKGHV